MLRFLNLGKDTKVVILLFLLNTVAINLLQAQSYNRQTDSLALVTFYNATDGPNWTNTKNNDQKWLTGPITAWKGVTVKGNRVTKIILTSNGLNGSIPPEVGQLTNLISLRLFDNQLRGNLPSTLANLSNLTELIIYDNQFTFSNLATCGIDPARMGYFYYAAQAKIEAPAVSINGNKVTLTITELHPANHYAWFINYIKIEGTDSRSFTFTPTETSLVYVQISNDIYSRPEIYFRNLILETKPLVFEPIHLPVILTVTNPVPVCQPGTIDISLPEVTAGSTEGLAFTYFSDSSLSNQLSDLDAKSITASGTYYIKGTDEFGTSDVKPVIVNINQKPVLNGTIVDVTCPGGNNGSIDLNVSVGKAPYSFNWSNSASSEDIFNLIPGTYNVAVTDANSCNAIKDFTVGQSDREKPIILTQNISVQLDQAGKAVITADQVNNGSTDNCGIKSISLSQTSFDCSNVGPNDVTLTITDLSGNVSTANAVVTVEDIIPPLAVAQNITVQLDANGSTSITADQINKGSSDNCGIASLKVNPTTFNCSNVGNNTVILTVTDKNGNTSTANAIVIVYDQIAPSIIAPAPISLLVEPGTTQIAVDLGQPIVNDNCAVKNTFNNAPALFTPGITNVTWTVSDKNGNSSSATQVVEINFKVVPNNALPVILSISSNSPVYLLNSASATAKFSDDNLVSAVWNWGDGSTSNGTISGDKVNGTHVYNEIGLYDVTLTIVDVRGETAQKVYSYIVVYDYSIGDVTGGGWISSDKGDNLLLATSDKGNYGFTAQYDKKKGVKGNFTFHLNSSNFDLKSTQLDWLVVYIDHAIFTGTAKLNGVSGFRFLASTVDVDVQKIGKADLLHIIVWNEQGEVIYDNEPNTGLFERPSDQITQGSIVIHGRKANTKSVLVSGSPVKDIETSLFAKLKVYPNPAINTLNIEIPAREEQAVQFEITDVSGRLIARDVSLEAWGQNATIELDRFRMKPGFYILKLQETDGIQSTIFRFMKK